MRILILQFVSAARDKPVPRFEPQLGVLLSLLEERGHDLSLLGLSRFDEKAIKDALARGLPQLVYADVASVCADVAQRTLQFIAGRQFLPVVGGGRLASVDPTTCLSMPGVEAIAVGEPDASLVTYFERMKDPAVWQVVSGVWLRDERGLERPELPALVEDLDSLPFPQRDLFNYAAHVERTGEIEIAIGRGCPQQCGYCANPALAKLSDGHGAWVRRRSPENVLEEIAELRERYPATRMVRFLDHAFALDTAWLDEFLAEYGPGCDLPFRCHLRANATTPELATKLAAAGCTIADIELISGSDFIRNEIFDMQLSAEQIDATFDALRAAQIRTRVILYLGSPYESEASLEDTLTMVRRLKPDLVDVRPYFPFPGTQARETCQENGWIHSGGEERFHQDHNGISMPACKPEIVEAFIRKARNEFPTAIGEPWWRRASRTAFAQFFPKRKPG